MPDQKIAFSDTGYYSKLILDYLEQDSAIKEYYNRFPVLEDFGQQIQEKSAAFPMENRRILRQTLERQYAALSPSSKVSDNIQALGEDRCFTVVTGHQLNIFTGPLYFIYKIVSTINLCKKLSENYPDYQFVPVYWMASEDHDFEEINFFNIHGKKMHWNRQAGGAVGRMTTAGLEQVFEVLQQELGETANAKQLESWFELAYLKSKSLAEATRFLIHQLFGDQGLLIIDGDDRDLKRLFVPVIRKELQESFSAEKVRKTNEDLQNKGYKIQVNPREINLFYLQDGLRERILIDGSGFAINNTPLVFDKERIRKEVEERPENFSPNVLLRPLYQECILPNLCYIGGGGELAYWLQLKAMFGEAKVPFPILLLRNSLLIVSEKQDKKREKLDLDYASMFLPKHQFINKKVREISNIDIDFSAQKKMLAEQFSNMYTLANETDKSFLGAVQAQERKQLKGLANLEQRLLKAQRRKLKDQVVRMTDLKQQLFPNESLQERFTNFSEWYLEYGENWMPNLLGNLDPLDLRFQILVMD
ncbi:MAG: bacillithiol biosynthesis cysteine-adding enzyme BshC [Flavobacteriaceae bacterium]|nr:bacillithiol biosynthesis cysteine-adding enzyme BshC [Flavobacteriaceae bacterium]